MTTARSFTLLCTIGVFCFISYNMVRMPVLALFAESLGAIAPVIEVAGSRSIADPISLEASDAHYRLPPPALGEHAGADWLPRKESR
jgi:hypothetical protein